MIAKVLVANRGEIALRIVRACRELEIETVAVFAAGDERSLHVSAADRALCLGPRQSYLDQSALLTAAKATGCDAIHPGYGFLSENADFARACEREGITWIGPPAKAIELMGNKALARQTMTTAGVPVIPGWDGDTDPLALRAAADAIGYPLLIKAAAGGGGKGMRAVDSAGELDAAVDAAKAEAGISFGNSEVYLERLMRDVRHIEVQELADSSGNVVHLGERDCSAQRRRQKLVEESPAPMVSNSARLGMQKAALAAAEAVNYTGAGTVEFIYSTQTDEYYFMEMNTRIQVEHCVSEMITGVDLVQWQLRIASGESLDHHQADIAFNGHAIECRINAEDPVSFLPNAGRLDLFSLPGGPGVRVDTHCYGGYEVPPHWDSLLAKLIVWAPTRQEAIARLSRALGEVEIRGVATTTDFHRWLIRRPEFRSGEIRTDTVEKILKERVLNVEDEE